MHYQHIVATHSSIMKKDFPSMKTSQGSKGQLGFPEASSRRENMVKVQVVKWVPGEWHTQEGDWVGC